MILTPLFQAAPLDSYGAPAAPVATQYNPPPQPAPRPPPRPQSPIPVPLPIGVKPGSIVIPARPQGSYGPPPKKPQYKPQPPKKPQYKPPPPPVKRPPPPKKPQYKPRPPPPPPPQQKPQYKPKPRPPPPPPQKKPQYRPPPPKPQYKPAPPPQRPQYKPKPTPPPRKPQYQPRPQPPKQTYNPQPPKQTYVPNNVAVPSKPAPTYVQPSKPDDAVWPQPQQDMAKITSLDVQCEKNLMKVSIQFDKPFNGIIFSKGFYSDSNCVHMPAQVGQNKATFDIAINSCGTTGNTGSHTGHRDTGYQLRPSDTHNLPRLVPSENGLYGYGADSGSGTYFENTIVVQYDPQVQEVWDQARKLRCTWHDQYEKSVTFRSVAWCFLGEYDVNVSSLQQAVPRGHAGRGAG